MDDLPPGWISLAIASRQKKQPFTAAWQGTEGTPKDVTITIVSNHFLDQHHSTMQCTSLSLCFWAHVRAYPFLVKTSRPNFCSLIYPGHWINKSWHHAWRALPHKCLIHPNFQPNFQGRYLHQRYQEAAGEAGSPRWAHFMVGSVHHSPWLREVCHFVEVMAQVGLEMIGVIFSGLNTLKKYPGWWLPAGAPGAW